MTKKKVAMLIVALALLMVPVISMMDGGYDANENDYANDFLGAAPTFTTDGFYVDDSYLDDTPYDDLDMLYTAYPAYADPIYCYGTLTVGAAPNTPDDNDLITYGM